MAPTAYLTIALVVVALTFGPEPSIGVPLNIPGPYAVLMELLPGFDGFRAPGRFAAFVILALAVLAGIGTNLVLSGLGRIVRYGAVVGVAVYALWDGRREYDWLAHLADETPSATAAYEWLEHQPPAAVYLSCLS